MLGHLKRLCVVMLAGLCAASPSALADPKSDYEMLFGKEAKKVLATKSTADDAALAGKIVDAAKAMTDAPKTQVFLYEKAVQFGGKDATGAPHALEAIELLIKAQPGQKAKWLEAKLNVTEKQFETSRGPARKEAAKPYLDVLIETAEARAAAGKPKEALALYRKAVSVAIYAEYKFTEIRDHMRDLTAAIEAEAEREKLIKKLAANPKDTKSREKLILIYVTELDDPAKAASLLANGVDEKLRQCVPLAAKKPLDLTETACMELGDWYKQLAAKASAKGRVVALIRANMYYERYLSLHTKRDVGRFKASAALSQVNKALASLGVAVPLPKSGGGKFLTLKLGKDVTMKLVLIPAGSFIMGSPETEKDRWADQGPQHKVTISKAFYMGVTEVTQEQYEAVMGQNPSKLKGPKNPVEQVSWDDAVAFCKKLSASTRRTVRLPSEAEWEYACRAGTKTVFCFGDDEKQLGDYAWYNVNSEGKPHPVAQKKPNPWGLYDIHGNVWEWCSDWHGSYASAAVRDPKGPASGSGRRVLRGGSCGALHKYCRSAMRVSHEPGRVSHDWGFRAVVSPD